MKLFQDFGLKKADVLLRDPRGLTQRYEAHSRTHLLHRTALRFAGLIWISQSAKLSWISRRPKTSLDTARMKVISAKSLISEILRYTRMTRNLTVIVAATRYTWHAEGARSVALDDVNRHQNMNGHTRSIAFPASSLSYSGHATKQGNKWSVRKDPHMQTHFSSLLMRALSSLHLFTQFEWTVESCRVEPPENI